MLKESYCREVLKELWSEKDVAQKLFDLHQIGVDGSVGADSDSDDKLLILMINQEIVMNNLENVLGKRYLKECGSYCKCSHDVFAQDLVDSVGCWLNEEEFKMKYRCSHLSLNAITKMIEDHNIFKKGK